MSKIEKLEEKLRNVRKGEVDFKDIRKVSENYGIDIAESNKGGSHFIASHNWMSDYNKYKGKNDTLFNKYTIPTVTGDKVKIVYVKWILDFIDYIKLRESKK